MSLTFFKVTDGGGADQWVNPNCIERFEPDGTGARLYFTSGEQVSVKETADAVLGLILSTE